MQTRIRYIARKRKGIVTENEKIVNKQTISIGRATDQDIFLSDLGVSYRHARLNILPDGVINISSVSNTGLYIDGSFVQVGTIKQSGEIIVGAFSIKISIDENKFTVDITIEKIAEDIVQVQSEHKLPTQLDQTWLSKRRMSWLGYFIILILFLGLPLAGFYNKDTHDMLQSFMLPEDDVWLSGEVSAPHQHFGNDCNQCHKQPFEMVQDKACISCHKKTTVHADPEMFDLSALHTTRCATCHKEHNGNTHLIQSDQKMCSDCHQSLSKQVETELTDISDFEKNHIEFKASIITKEGLSKFNPKAWDRVSLDDQQIRHVTSLVFPHDVHLDYNGINSPKGNKVLICNDCHQTDSSGNYMLPVEMETHCQSCHRLEFDPDDLERELPHSDLKNLKKMLEEYYSLAALRGNYDEDEAPDLIKQRRRPGKNLTRKEQAVALKWAKEKAQDVAEEVVEFRSCNLCHKVEANPESELGWIIPDVNISQKRWLPKGEFEHETHQNTQCKTCHEANTSKQSEDVLLPKIKVCRECHGGQHSDNQLKSSCISCHKFHQPGKMLMENRGEDSL
jgi:pSer/pThr/pTyr-binding forkhead associated (FHA) protein